jgi:hypothetical protein
VDDHRDSRWEQETFQAVLRSLASAGGTHRRETKLRAQILEDLWNHRRTPSALTPTAVASRIYSAEIEKETAAKRSVKRDEVLKIFRDRLRVAVTDLRNHLGLFFDTERGRRLPYRMTIADRVYELEFSSAAVPLKKFWSPFCDDTACRIIVAAPLFLRHSRRRLFLRLQDLNRERNFRRFARNPGKMPGAARASRLLQALAEEAEELSLGRPYTTVGELHALISLTECFRSLGIQTRSVTAPEIAPPLTGNTVLLGNVRTNPFMLLYPRRLLAIRQRARSLVITRLTGTTAVFQDDIRPYGTVYGLISRFGRLPDSGGAAVALAAHYHHAIAALARITTDESAVTKLVEDAGFARAAELPANLEILLEFKLDERERIKEKHWHVVDAFPKMPSAT